MDNVIKYGTRVLKHDKDSEFKDLTEILNSYTTMKKLGGKQDDLIRKLTKNIEPSRGLGEDEIKVPERRWRRKSDWSFRSDEEAGSGKKASEVHRPDSREKRQNPSIASVRYIPDDDDGDDDDEDEDDDDQVVEEVIEYVDMPARKPSKPRKHHKSRGPTIELPAELIDAMYEAQKAKEETQPLETIQIIEFKKPPPVAAAAPPPPAAAAPPPPAAAAPPPPAAAAPPAAPAAPPAAAAAPAAPAAPAAAAPPAGR